MTWRGHGAGGRGGAPSTYCCVRSNDLPSADNVNRDPYGLPINGSAGTNVLPSLTLLHG